MKSIVYIVSLMLAFPTFGAPATRKQSILFNEMTFFSALDLKTCLRWNISNEPIYPDYIKAGEEKTGYESAMALLKRQPLSYQNGMSDAQRMQAMEADPYEIATVYEASGGYYGSYKKGDTIRRFSVCKPSYPSGFTCLPGQDFPLSGAVYRVIRSKGSLKTLGCRTGCTSKPSVIYDTGYETDEEDVNVEYEAALKIFNKKCSNKN